MRKIQFEEDLVVVGHGTRADPTPRSGATKGLSGGALILLSLALGVLGLLSGGAIGTCLLGASGLMYFAGAIRWAVSGARMAQLEDIQRQIGELRALLVDRPASRD